MTIPTHIPPVFITGGTGYIGSRLTRLLLARGHNVIMLVRKGSEHKAPPGAEVIVGNPFDRQTFQQQVPRGSVFVQLLGVSHPSPKKAKQFIAIDLRSLKESADAAEIAGVSHFIYISVAMTPSRLMKQYQEVRKEGESYCLARGLKCTFIRPWYVLGPGHWWPVLLLPFYGLAELVPSWREKARAMGLVTIHQVINTLIEVIEKDPPFPQILETGQIRRVQNSRP